MWKTLNKLITPIVKHQGILLTPEPLINSQFRTTFVLKRRVAPYMHKKGALPKRLRNRHFIYDLVQDTDCLPQAELQVILTKYVEGLGDKGDRVMVKRNFAYNNLLLPGLAVYPTDENREKYKEIDKSLDTVQHSSPTAKRTVDCLTRLVLTIVMNKEIPWILEPWHVKASFRKCGYHVPVDAITMPSKQISGPNLDLEVKQFYVTVTVNNLEKVNVRCQIHHWSTDITEKLSYVPEYWKLPSEPLFPEDAPELQLIQRKADAITDEFGNKS